MKLIYIHQYFITPAQAGGARSYYLSKALVEQGHEVVVITSNTKHEDYAFTEHKTIDGIRVIYIKNFYDASMGKLNRIFSFIKFMIFSTYYVLKEKDVDLIYATSTPLTIGVPALIANLFKKTKFIFEVRDVWPDIPYEMGYIKNKYVYKVLKLLEKKIYNKSEKIICISEGIKNKIDVAFRNKCKIYPFGANLKLFNTKKSTQWKLNNNIKAPCLYVFTGAIGLANGIQYLIEAAKILKDNKKIHISIVGDGSDRERIKLLIKEHSLSNITLHDPVEIQNLNEIFASAEAGIILFGDTSESYRYTASPNKFFDYIAAGLPFFFNFEGPLKDKVLKHNIGIYTNYQDAAVLAEKMMYFSENTQELKILALNARVLAEEEYNRDIIYKKLVKEIIN